MTDISDRDAAILALRPSVEITAWHLRPRDHALLDYADVCQEGWCGALESVDAYQPDHGAGLTHFAQWRIRGAIQDAYRRASPFSRQQRATGQEEQTCRALWRRAMTVERRQEAVAQGDLTPQLAAQEAWASMQRLPLRQQQVLRLYYGAELTMAEVGQRLGLTESRVSQLHTLAIQRLRKYFRVFDAAVVSK